MPRDLEALLDGNTVHSSVDNVANNFFKTQKKSIAKQARWQELVADFDFVWVHKPGLHNQVAGALSRKEVESYVRSLNQVVEDFTKRVRQEAQKNRHIKSWLSR